MHSIAAPGEVPRGHLEWLIGEWAHPFVIPRISLPPKGHCSLVKSALFASIVLDLQMQPKRINCFVACVDNQSAGTVTGKLIPKPAIEQ